MRYDRTEVPNERGCTLVIMVLPFLCFSLLVFVELFHKLTQQQKPVGAASNLNHLKKSKLLLLEAEES